MTIYQRIISDIVCETGIRSISDSQSSKIENILKDCDLEIDEKITSIMEALRLRGSLYRKDVSDVIDLYFLDSLS